MAPELSLSRVTLERPDRKGGSKNILTDISTSFHSGRVALITGPTGCGKSTLLHVLGALLKPTAGTVYAGPCPVSRWTTRFRDSWRRQTGFVFQHFHLIRDLTVLENVLLPLLPCGGRLEHLRRRAWDILTRTDLADLAGAKPMVLSGGERQRIAVARALAGRPAYVMADEPTAHQDSPHAAALLTLLKQQALAGSVVVVAGHDPRLQQAGFADNAYELNGGRLAAR